MPVLHQYHSFLAFPLKNNIIAEHCSCSHWHDNGSTSGSVFILFLWWHAKECCLSVSIHQCVCGSYVRWCPAHFWWPDRLGLTVCARLKPCWLANAMCWQQHDCFFYQFVLCFAKHTYLWYFIIIHKYLITKIITNFKRYHRKKRCIDYW